MIAAGIGVTSTAGAQAIVAAVRQACAQAGIEPAQLGCLGAYARPRTADAVKQAARELGQPLVVFDARQLHPAAGFCATWSHRSMAAAGVPSVAEAAALVAAGMGARLLQERMIFAGVTVALAQCREAIG